MPKSLILVYRVFAGLVQRMNPRVSLVSTPLAMSSRRSIAGTDVEASRSSRETSTGYRCSPGPAESTATTVIRIGADPVQLANAPEHLPGIALGANDDDTCADHSRVVVEAVADDAAVVGVAGLVNTVAIRAVV